MRFEINAADRQTGDELVLGLLAASEQEAVAKANAAGYLVGQVRPARSPAAGRPPELRPDTGRQRPW